MKLIFSLLSIFFFKNFKFFVLGNIFIMNMEMNLMQKVDLKIRIVDNSH